MKEIFVSPLLAGLSVGIYCFTYCIPFVAPFMVSNERTKAENFFIIIKFIAGRLIGYIIFGALIGYLGQKIDNEIINMVMTFSLLILSIIMILHAIGLLKSDSFSFCAKLKNFNSKLPLLMGFLMGINICPPFLMSITYVFTLHSISGGVVYFLMFFIGTTFYILPVFFLGYLNRMKEFQLVGRTSAMIVGVAFLVYSLYKITCALVA